MAKTTSFLVLFLLASSACEIHVGSPPSPAAAPPPTAVAHRASAPPPAHPAPPPPAHPATPQPPHPAHLAIAKAESVRRIAIRLQPPPPAPNVQTTVNLTALARVPQGSSAKACAPFEAAPGVFVHLDCKKYSAVPVAKQVNPAKKVLLFKLGRLRLDPPAPGAVTATPLVGSGVATGDGATPQQQAPQQAFPDTVDHRAQGIEGAVKNQGLVGDCTAFSLSTVMDNAIRRLNKNDMTSSMHLWSHYAQPDMAIAGASNHMHPIAIWSDYPYDLRSACRLEHSTVEDQCDMLQPPALPGTGANDPVVQAQIQAADNKGRYEIAEIDQYPTVDPDLFVADLAMGKDIWLAMDINTDAWSKVSGGVIHDWATHDGGHAIAFAGYRLTPNGRQFLVHNSWGTRWGDGGYAWISEAMVRQHVSQVNGQPLAYTLKVVDLSAPPPPPTPLPSGNGGCAQGYTTTPGIPVCQRLCAIDSDCGPGGVCVNISPTSSVMVCVAANPLTDDDCGGEEVVDLVTGLCAAICPNGTRPAAAQCSAAHN